MNNNHNYYSQLVLNRFNQLQKIRIDLLNELNNPLLLETTSSEPDTTTTHHSNCQHEHNQQIKANPEDYIQQLISISTSGFIEIRDEIKLLMEILNSDLKRTDLFELIERIEGLEAEKISEYLRQTLLKRKARLEDRDYNQLIDNSQEKLDLLVKSISELTEEVQAELAELT